MLTKNKLLESEGKYGYDKVLENAQFEALEAAQTALAYRLMLAKVLQVTEGFDYRANIKFTMSDCIGVEIEAKAMLKSGEVGK